jgi:hypothetical protein|nr:hypothetical protein [uncultured Pseudogulbenkiania sp.]
MDTPTPDEIAGMAWWNSLPEQDRTRWMSRAGDTGRAADAWAVFKRDSLSGSDMTEKPNAGAAALPPAMGAPVYEPSSGQVGEEASNSLWEEVMRRHAERPVIEAKGREALGRLIKVAQRDTGQSRKVAAFLLGCYNGTRFPFDLTDFRGLDFSLFEDCMTVLRMDYQPSQEVHCYFKNGGALFERLATDHGLKDVYRLQVELDDLRNKFGPG